MFSFRSPGLQGWAALIVGFMGKLYINFYFVCDFYS